MSGEADLERFREDQCVRGGPEDRQDRGNTALHVLTTHIRHRGSVGNLDWGVGHHGDRSARADCGDTRRMRQTKENHELVADDRR